MIRPARPADVPDLVQLMHEHASFERSAPPSQHLVERLPAMMFASDAPIHAIVAESSRGLVGYATCSIEVSTWQGEHYLHLDCLFLRPASRGGGTGTRMMNEITNIARERGLRQVQWQTPDWNESAIRFYERTGAATARKLRYVLELAERGF
jgi:ribosomal protein S18 acetylase RimI-like enzyme